MKYVSIFCMLVIFTFLGRSLTAQTDMIDSLKSRLSQTTGEERINTLIFLSEANRIHDFEECILIGKEAINFAKETNELNLQALATKSVGVSYLYEGDLEQALLYFEESLDLYTKIDNQQGIANSLNNIGLVYLELGKYKNAKDYYEKKFNIVKTLGNKKSMASALVQIGNINYYVSDFQKALDNYYKANILYIDIGDIIGQADAYYSMGVIYSEIQSFQKALEFYDKADSIYRESTNIRDLSHVLNNKAKIYSFEIKDFELAEELYLESLDLKKQLNDNIGIAMSYNNLGTLYGNKGDYKESLSYFNKSKELYREIGSESGLIMVGYNLGELYCERNDVNLGIDYYQESLEMAIKNGEVGYINKNYEALFFAYAKQCDFERFNYYYRLFSIGKDTLIDRLYQSEVDAVEAKYKVEELLQEKTTLYRSNELKLVKIRRYKLIFGGMLVLFVLLVAINVFLWRKK